eukprot:199440-Lingulodinium_polyedra.AAC.1
MSLKPPAPVATHAQRWKRRRTQPRDITAAEVLAAFRNCSDVLQPELQRIRLNPSEALIKIDWNK